MFFKKYLSKFLMLSSLILILITTIFLIDAEASTGTYDVYYLKVVNGKVEFGDIIASKSSFDEAKKIILEDPNGVIVSEKSKSPLKIVAATRGQAQSYPYRKGKRDAEVILNIYTDKGLTNALTYIPAHYLMYVYDYELYVGRIIANVEIQGGRGYVEVDKVDIIPMIYI